MSSTRFTALKWYVGAWQERDGQSYCFSIRGGPLTSLDLTTEWNRPDSGDPAEILVPRAAPLVVVSYLGELRETRTFTAAQFQQVIDNAQRMVRENRP